MRRAILSALMITLLLLPGCGEREERLEKSFSQFREDVTLAQEITLEAELTANYGGTAATYTLSAVYDGQQTEIEVLSPDIIAGVKATVLRGETTVSYENVLLGAGAVDEEGLTPVSAIPVMLDAMASGYTELLWWEGDYIVARLYVGEQSVLTLWLDQDSLAPISSEIATAGETVIACSFTQWSIT
ncbi:MAG: hypothetical protein LUC89_06140 [Oscillospiraceae bacterium]|nr:hypothetical protein [Oscillospiraceae bacterium]